jgi:hypothetical protein
LREASAQTTFEWSGLFLEKIAPQLRDVSRLDASLESLLQSKLPWSQILTYLLQSHQKFARVLHNHQDTITDLVLFNPSDSDFLLFLKWSIDVENQQESLRIFMASRAGVRDSVEYDHVNDIVNSILYYLWSQ